MLILLRIRSKLAGKTTWEAGMHEPFMIHVARLAPAFMTTTFFILYYHFFVHERKLLWAIGLFLLGALISYRSLTLSG